jgi:2-succinyl-5-enolpyruvyl-6-hydroxy-3-cyclohexene-1-carboxylate synthase
MSSATDTYVLLRAFVDELARSGMRAACTSPGSRCAPLVLTLASDPRLRCYSHIDERGAGFFALGLAKASGLPVAITCTSGTAAAELLPAAIEAHEARVPLLLLTADRPPELRENGAGQAIDQLKLFGSAAKWFFEVGTHDSSPERLRWIRTLACRAYATAIERPSGVVHLNFPLREPLVTDAPLPDDATGRPGGEPYVRRMRSTGPRQKGAREAEATLDCGFQVAQHLRDLIAGARRGVIVAGRDERLPAPGQQSSGEIAAAFAATMRWPLLADPMSGARRGEAAIAHYDTLLRDADFRACLDPDLILRIGDLPVSKPLRTWLGNLPNTRQVALDRDGAWQDPSSALSDSLDLDHIDAFPAITRDHVEAADETWLAAWRSGDELAAEAIRNALSDDQGLSEPAVAAELGALLPANATLFVSSSMPVRDIESYWLARPDPPRVLCNRGANGIDGIVSTAFGVSATDPGPVVLLTGDVALAHDIGGLLSAKRLGLSLVIVLLNNEGGGIFDFLPIGESPMARKPDTPPNSRPRVGTAQDLYTIHVLTPPGLNFADAAALYGLHHTSIPDVAALRTALRQAFADRTPAILEVRCDRASNLRLHRAILQRAHTLLHRDRSLEPHPRGHSH